MSISQSICLLEEHWVTSATEGHHTDTLLQKGLQLDFFKESESKCRSLL